MRKSSKKQAMLLCSAALALSLSIGVPTLLTKAETPDLTATEGKFYVVDGASVKIDAIGIRFTTVVEKGYYEAVRAAYPNAEFHTEFYEVLTDGLLQDVKYTHGLEYCENSALNMSGTAKNVDGYQYHVSMEYDELDQLYQKLALGYELYAKSYVKLNDTTKIYAESNEVVRSMKQVAELASADDVAGLGQYYENVYLNDGVEYYEKAVSGETVAVSSLPADTTATGALTAYIGDTALTDVTFGAGTVNFGDETLAKLTAGEIYRLTVVGETQGVWSAPFKCITKFTDNETFIADMEAYKSDASAYLMLSEDVDVGYGAYKSLSSTDANGGIYQVWGSVYALNKFDATLDGDGHKISLRLDYNEAQANNLNNKTWYVAGLFQALNGTIKNLEYDCVSTYLINTDESSGDRGFFAFQVGATSRVENCYIHATLIPTTDGTTKAVDKKAVLITMGTNTTQNVVFENVIFDANYVTSEGNLADTYITGDKCKGTNMKNCVFIDDGTPFKPSFNSGYYIYVTASYTYPSFEAFVKGTDGKACSGRFTVPTLATYNYVETTIEGTVQKYDTLEKTGVWAFEDGNIYLCGSKVYPEDRVVTATIVGNMLNVTDSQIFGEKVYDVYVGEEKVGTFTGTSCDVLEILKGKLVAGENTFTVTVKTASGTAAETTATATYIGLTQENFLSVVSASTATDYMVMLENVSFTNVRTDENYAYANATFGTINWTYIYAIPTLQGVLDGQGNKIEVTLNAVMDATKVGESNNCWTLGLFHTINATVRNLEYSIEGEYRFAANKNKGFFAFQTGQSTFENCYIHAKMKAIGVSGTVQTATNDTQAYMIAAPQNALNGNDLTGVGSFNYCIFEIKVYNATTSAYVDVKLNSPATFNFKLNNCVFITSAGSAEQFTTFTQTAYAYRITATNCAKYATLADFISGTNGYTCAGLIFAGTNTTPYTETAIASGNAWSVLNESSAWKVTATGITLCGVSIYTVEA